MPPERGFLQAWEQGTMWPQAHPGKGWNASSKAWETGKGLELTISSVSQGYINKGSVGKMREVIGWCNTRDSPVMTSPVSDLFWPRLSAQALDPELCEDSIPK